MNVLVMLTGIDLKVDRTGIVRFRCKGSVYDAIVGAITGAVGGVVGATVVAALKLERM